MKFIVAVIKPQKLDAVRDALNALGVSGMTVSDVKGYGRQKGHKEIYRGAEYQVDFIPKVRIEVAIADDQAQAALTAIRDAARTGAIGDGKIFMVDLVEAVRVRTGETGQDAL
ncbi:MAG: P-II family nitrogen regulator [Parvularculaceae bacterium]|jgi:nitrogen regulatory protein P-II 2|nr:P-II family nitrogen regulator [Parvularculaceae bacterium]